MPVLFRTGGAVGLGSAYILALFYRLANAQRAAEAQRLPSEFGGSGKAVSGIDRIQDGRIWLMGMGWPIALRMTGG
jgi:hypothetical protein